MEFIKADVLKKQFSVFGHFYKLKLRGVLYPCRSVLEIVANDVSTGDFSNPCAVVVMMNPGSSKPVDSNYTEKVHLPYEIRSNSWEKELVPTKPDPAQYQIMRLMLLVRWSHVRVINLSDLRNGNSGNFAEDFSDASSLDPSEPFCISDSGRRTELLTYCQDAPHILAGWGSVEVLRKQAITFLDTFSSISGIALERPWYAYPSPSMFIYKIRWLENIQPTICKRNITNP
jgi:hypothetical protein